MACPSRPLAWSAKLCCRKSDLSLHHYCLTVQDLVLQGQVLYGDLIINIINTIIFFVCFLYCHAFTDLWHCCALFLGFQLWNTGKFYWLHLFTFIKNQFVCLRCFDRGNLKWKVKTGFEHWCVIIVFNFSLCQLMWFYCEIVSSRYFNTLLQLMWGLYWELRFIKQGKIFLVCFHLSKHARSLSGHIMVYLT